MKPAAIGPATLRYHRRAAVHCPAQESLQGFADVGQACSWWGMSFGRSAAETCLLRAAVHCPVQESLRDFAGVGLVFVVVEVLL